MTVRKRDIFDAIVKGDPRLVKALAMTGADLDAKTPGGRSVLQVAVLIGNAAVLSALLELGCDINEQDSNTEMNLLEWLLYNIWNTRLSAKEEGIALLLIKEGLEVRENALLANAREKVPERFLQVEELIMNCRNLQAADEGRTVPTGYEFDI